MEIAMDMLGGRMSLAKICRKWDISSTRAYKIRYQALELVLKDMKRSSKDIKRLSEGVKDLKKLVRDHSFVVSYLKKKLKR
jgi:hypothetical protein